MSFNLQRENFLATEDQRWVGSKFGTNEAQTVTLDGAAFTTVADGGVIRSGIAITRRADGLFIPATDPTKVDGFLLTTQKASQGPIVAPMLDHGRILAFRAPKQVVDVSSIVHPQLTIVTGAGKKPNPDPDPKPKNNVPAQDNTPSDTNLPKGDK